MTRTGHWMVEVVDDIADVTDEVGGGDVEHVQLATAQCDGRTRVVALVIAGGIR